MKEGVDKVGRLSLQLHRDNEASYHDRIVISGEELLVWHKPSRHTRLRKVSRRLTIERRVATYNLLNLTPQTLQSVVIMLLVFGLHEVKPEMWAPTVYDLGILNSSRDENHVTGEVIEPV